MLQVLEDKPNEDRPAGLRADYELLKEDGLLMRYLKHMTGIQRLSAVSGV
jgi:predicted type IV restriction endonuclease